MRAPRWCAGAAAAASLLAPAVPGGAAADTPNQGLRWPAGAGTCLPCLKTAGGSTCYVHVPGFAVCPPYHECTLGTCACAQNFCEEDGMCSPMRCTGGTRPPRYVASRWAERLAQFGPEPPPAGSSQLRWHLHSFLDLGAPLVLFALGVVAAWATYVLLTSGLKTRLCRRAPRVPVFLTLWSVATLIYAISGSSKRQQTISHVFQDASAQLTLMKSDLDNILKMSYNISDVEERFRETNDMIPRSCLYKQYTEKLMVSMVNLVDKATNEGFNLVGRLNNIFQALPAEIGHILFQSYLVTIFLGYVPMLPMLIEIVGVIAIALFSCMAYYNPAPDVSERAKAALQRYGSKFFPALILTSTGLAAIYLQCGIVVGTFCLDVDANVLGIINHKNFTLYGQPKADLDLMTVDIRSTADFYVAGITPNPAQKLVQELSTQVQTFSIVRNATVLIQKVAGTICPIFHELQMDATIASLQDNVHAMQELLRPEHVYPFYETVVHKIACEEFPHHVWELVWFNAIMGLVMLPVLAVTADVDLERMVNYKRNHGGTWSNLEEEQSEQDDGDEGSSSHSEGYSEPPLSAPTYTHISKTTVYADRPQGRDSSGPKSTFFA